MLFRSGFPKKLARPQIAHEGDVVVCTLHYGTVLCVSATMGFKHREIDPVPLLKALARSGSAEPLTFCMRTSQS